MFEILTFKQAYNWLHGGRDIKICCQKTRSSSESEMETEVVEDDNWVNLERIFSGCGQIATKFRFTLNDGRFDILCFLRINLKK